MKKRILSACLALLCVLSWVQVPAGAVATLPGKGEYVIGRDLSALDLRDQLDLITTWNYDLSTKWPAADKLPQGFSPQAFMDWGKDPGLGIRRLHAMGYTGKGVSVGYVDLVFDRTHPELDQIDLHYDIVSFSRNEFHGTAVMSLLSGKEIGVAPDATVYFEGHRGFPPTMQPDQAPDAEAIRRLIKLNQTLPEKEQIKVIGFSDNIDPSEQNVEDFRKATQEAADAGIYVLFCGKFAPIVAKPFSDRADPKNYYPINWDAEQIPFFNGNLYVPMDRCVASTDQQFTPREKYNYVKFYLGGLSWTAPYVTGLMAIGLQIDPSLTGEKMLALMKETAYRPAGITAGGVLDPVAFATRVARDAGKVLEPLGDYQLCLFNSDRVSSQDFAALRAHASGVTADGKQAAILLDTKECHNAAQVYDAIKAYQSSHAGTLAGIQIFGTAADVPAFNLRFEVEMGAEIDRAGTFLSDYFYGNTDNSASALTDFSLYQNFHEEQNVDLIPDWPVVRLPLSLGDFGDYFEKVDRYVEQVGAADRPRLVNFSNPIFMQQNHSDDLGWFLQNRMEREFHILKSSDYIVYGNQQGLYPTNAKVAGDFTPENMKLENEKGVMDLLISSHGQLTNIDRAIFVKTAEMAQYSAVARTINPQENGLSEVRISALNTENIDDVLGTNYYNLMTWTCNNAVGLDERNLAYAALDGSAINVFAATHIMSNNGANNKANLSQMEHNNFYYFYYNFLKHYYSGETRAESFFRAKQAYVQGCLARPIALKAEGNFQFNLHNALTYQHLGLLTVTKSAPVAEPILLPAKGKIRNGNTTVPMRLLFEALGYKVDWIAETQKISAQNGSQHLWLTLGQPSLDCNGALQAMPLAPFAEHGVTYIPLRAVSEATGCTVNWDNENKIAAVYTPEGLCYQIETEH